MLSIYKLYLKTDTCNCRKSKRERKREGEREMKILRGVAKLPSSQSAAPNVWTSFRQHPPTWPMIDCSSFFILNENAPRWQEFGYALARSLLVGQLLCLRMKMSVHLSDCSTHLSRCQSEGAEVAIIAQMQKKKYK